MSGLSFFQNDNYDDEIFGDGSTAVDLDEHQQHIQHQTSTEMDRLSTKLNLRRLLYRMERYEDLSVLQDEKEAETSNSNTNTKTTSHCQSWQSLLVRAQLCQDLWQNVASENVDEGSDPALRKEYMELSKRVDAACKRARFLADQARERDVAAGRDKGLVEKLFFPQPQVSDDDDEEEEKTGGENDSFYSDGGESDGEDEYYDEEFQDKDDGDIEPQDRSSRRGKSSHRSSPNDTTTNLQDLQKAQREQIEEAISMMAKQMKESTQGIQKTLQKQNASTLNELETVAEQNMEDVSKVAANVKEHVVANQRSSWASWTTLILIAGFFVFTLLTIFTIPKHPDANLGRILSGANENGPYARLLKKTIHKIRSVLDVNNYFFDGDKGNIEHENEEEQNEAGWDHHDIQEDEAARQERERLEELVRDMQRGGRKTQRQKQQEKLRQQQQEQEERLQTKIKEQKEQEQLQEELEWREKVKQQQQQQELEWRERQKQQQQEIEKQEKFKQQQEIEKQEKLKQQELEPQEKLKYEKELQEMKEKTELSDEVPAPEPIFARDIRAAAYSNNYKAIKRYLEVSPSLINEQDEDGWTALHLAVHAKHSRIVKFLLEQWWDEELSDENIDPNKKLHGENQETAFRLALENYGLDHPVTKVFFETEWYARSNFEEFEEKGDLSNENYKGELPYSNENVNQRMHYEGFKKRRRMAPEEENEDVDDVESLTSEFGDEEEENDDEDIENPWGIKPEEEIDDEVESDEKENDVVEELKPTKEVNVNDILASLREQQKASTEPLMEIEEPDGITDDESFNAAYLIEREGVAAKMVSPRDFRLAAASGDYDTLERYLEMAPQHINRQDKYGWTALHMAVHAKQERIVLLLLDQYYKEEDMAELNIDPLVESFEEERTALDLALEQFGLDHPITDAFLDTEWYDRSDFEDWEDEETRLRKQRLLEHEARIVKEKEAIRVKEERFAAAAEEERRIKKDKLNKLFGTPMEEEEDEIDEDTIQERRSRLDALLDEL